ncbi:MAG: hypothetical protein DKT66_26170 [Candidatus Melainabacteria bacterium]|nr:MAG: hypothetical protein DKT66_26170 [Candidatus Melainabacteria bacterium]
MLMARRFTKSSWLLQMTFYVTQKSSRKPGDFGSQKYFDGPKKLPHLRTFSLLRMLKSVKKETSTGRRMSSTLQKGANNAPIKKWWRRRESPGQPFSLRLVN